MKIRRTISILLALTIAALCAFTGCTKNRASEDAETIDSENESVTDEIQLLNYGMSSPTVYRSCEAVNGVSVVNDTDGLSLINESTGKKTQFYENTAVRDLLFNGKSVIFSDQIINDDVKVTNPSDYYEDQWYVCYVDEYDLESKSSHTLFTSNGIDPGLIYFDSSCLYYTDVADKNVGDYKAVESITPSLFKFDFETGEKTVISEYACSAESFGSFIFYNALESYPNQSDDYVNPGPIHIYDTKNGKDVKVDDYGELLYSENDRFYFIHIINKNDTITGGEVKSCKSDGSDVKTVIKIDGRIARGLNHYVTVALGTWADDDTKEKVINTKTGKDFIIPSLDCYYLDNQLIASSEKADDPKIYRYNDSGKKELYVDLSSYNGVDASADLISKTENGIYVCGYVDGEYVIKFIKSDN